MYQFIIRTRAVEYPFRKHPYQYKSNSNRLPTCVYVQNHCTLLKGLLKYHLF